MGMLKTTSPPNRTFTSRTLSLMDRHGKALMLLAEVLVGDARQAETEVAAVLVDAGRSHRTLRGEPNRQDLGASLFRQCGFRLLPGAELRPTKSEGDFDEPLGDWAEVPARARVSLALCIYGGQTYSGAANLLGIPREEVASDLLMALRHLASQQLEQFRCREADPRIEQW